MRGEHKSRGDCRRDVREEEALPGKLRAISATDRITNNCDLVIFERQRFLFLSVFVSLSETPRLNKVWRPYLFGASSLLTQQETEGVCSPHPSHVLRNVTIRLISLAALSVF